MKSVAGATLVSEHLKAQGFATASFIANGYVSDRFGFDQGWDHYTNFIREGKNTDASAVFGEAQQWIESHHDRRFFVYIQTIDPHVPYDPPAEYLRMYDPREDYAGQVTPRSTHEALRTLDFEPIHPLTGPVYVKGAEPGDALDVEIVRLKHKGWGWNGVLPGFGLLADDFTSPYLHHYKLTKAGCVFRKDIVIPYEPFCGVMGVAPREPGRLNTIPPRQNGGNVDIRHLTPGARLHLTQGLAVSPRSTAFFASRPAATMTDGFDVFVQLVMAAMTIEPWVS